MGSKIFTEQEKQSLFQNAIDIVHEAGKITMGYFKQNLVIENKDENFFNPVTVADRSAEKKIREIDEFEGKNYQRVVAEIHSNNGLKIQAYLYEKKK